MPSTDVCSLFNALIASLDEEVDTILDQFIIYFELVWIGPVQRGKKRKPMFEIELWSVYSRILDDLPKTNNSLEGWHNGLKQRIAVSHPTEPKLVRKLKFEQANTEFI